MTGVKVLVDGMCGRLARWLRMLGFDASYCKECCDDELVDMAIREGRVLITRDVELHERALRAGARSILVESPDHVAQLASVIAVLGGELRVDPDRSRCPTCNAPLRRASKDEVRGLVPEGTYRVHDEFWLCTGCSKVYWRGSHWRGIMRVLEEARKMLNSRLRGEGGG